MDKELYCKDMGIDCDLMVCGKTVEEVLTKAGQHVQAMPCMASRDFQRSSIIKHDQPSGRDIVTMETLRK
jgi:hypothetical protein